MPKIAVDPQFFFSHQQLQCLICQCAKFNDNFENLGSEVCQPLIAENLVENFSKIQGGGHHDQLRKLSSHVVPASSDTEITPLNPLGAKKFGVKFSNLTLNISKAGKPHPQICNF